jgi:hypothetical protein
LPVEKGQFLGFLNGFKPFEANLVFLQKIIPIGTNSWVERPRGFKNSPYLARLSASFKRLAGQ